MDALAEIKKLGLNIPLILVTGMLGDKLAVECIKQGISDYVLKDQLARLPAALLRAQEEKGLRDAETRALDALRVSERRYRGLVHNATYGMIWLTAGGEILAVNPAFVRMLGYDSAEEVLAIGNASSFYNDPGVYAGLREKYTESGRADTTVDWKRKDGRIITVHLSERRVDDENQCDECAEVIVEDVTERLALEKKLLHVQKFEAFGQLAGGIAHDFNNMIGAIMGWSDMGIEETAGRRPAAPPFPENSPAGRACRRAHSPTAGLRPPPGPRAAQYRPQSGRHRNAQSPRKSYRQQY